MIIFCVSILSVAFSFYSLFFSNTTNFTAIHAWLWAQTCFGVSSTAGTVHFNLKRCHRAEDNRPTFFEHAARWLGMLNDSTSTVFQEFPLDSASQNDSDFTVYLVVGLSYAYSVQYWNLFYLYESAYIFQILLDNVFYFTYICKRCLL